MDFIYFKNSFLPENQCHISVYDRSFRFGDGIFDTCLIANSKLYNFFSHLARLENGLKAYKIDLDISDLENICRELIKKNSVSSGYLRITISRGENAPDATGYLPKNATPYLLIQTNAKPYPAFKAISLLVSSQLASKSLPFKSNDSLGYTLAMLEAANGNCDNALLLNKDGTICETASGNIFWVKDSVLYTPSDELEMIPGTMRAKVLELWDGAKQTGKFALKDLQHADEVFMSNVGLLIAPVSNLLPSGNKWPIGAVTELLRKKLDNDIMRSTA